MTIKLTLSRKKFEEKKIVTVSEVEKVIKNAKSFELSKFDLDDMWIVIELNDGSLEPYIISEIIRMEVEND